MALRDWFWIILLGAIWGCSFIFNAVLIREIGPLWVTSFRVAIGALGCWLVMLALRKPMPRDPALWLQLGLLGVVAYAIPFALFPLAQAHLASGVAATSWCRLAAICRPRWAAAAISVTRASSSV